MAHKFFAESFNPINFKRRRVCADCWGDLIVWYDNPTVYINCVNKDQGCPCRGTISRQTMIKAMRESPRELLAAEEALRDAAPWIEHARKRPDENKILKELGF